MPTVSVIMPCYNHGKFLRESIESVLNQSYSDLELIVIDDFSKDESIEIIEKYKRIEGRIQCIVHGKNMGASKSRNDGIMSSKGKLIAFCDADDVWLRDKLKIQIEQLRKNTMYDVVYCDSIIIDEHGFTNNKLFSSVFAESGRRSGDIFAQLCVTNFVNMQTVLLNSLCLRSGQLFNERIKWVEDWLFWITLARKHAFLYLDCVLSKYRVHSVSSARIHQKSKIINSIKVYSEVLSRYSDISPGLRSKMLYQVGIALSALGKRSAARKMFLRSCLTDKWNFRAFCRLFISKPRLRIASEQ